MCDVACHLEQPLKVPTLDTVMIMVKEVARFQPMVSPSVQVSCSSSLKDPVPVVASGCCIKIYMALYRVCQGQIL